MDGYIRDPEATAAVMSGAWFHTGDMAVWDEEGYIQIVDRKKDIIISGGENISSIEVEKAIAAHPGVLEVAVVGAPDPQWGEIPVAFVLPRPGRQFPNRSCGHSLRRVWRSLRCRVFMSLSPPSCRKAVQAKF